VICHWFPTVLLLSCQLYNIRVISIIANLVLEDGSVFPGRSVGAPGNISAEVSFTTSMAGYQEAVTDPSYTGQALVFSYPLIGNYGVSSGANQSTRAHTRAVVMRQSRPVWSGWLARNGVVAIDNVDTRAVVSHIRNFGAMRCAVGEGHPDELLEMALAEPHIDFERSLLEPDLVMPPLALEVGTSEPYSVGTGPSVVIVDLGCKASVIDAVVRSGLEARVVPGEFDADAILDFKPRAVLIGNGPGDPAQLGAQVETIGALFGTVPIFGICLGHQLIALALGMETFKLPFGHRGVNHPVQDVRSGQVSITSQNHGFGVDAGESGFVTHVSLNDGTVEGIAGDGLRSVQFHPEATPGPNDAFGFFEEMRASCRSVPISTAS
jgi:carbamoyl-phosphate synthase small subunit